MSKAGGGDMSNLPDFFQTSRTGHLTVLDGLDALEDGEELGGLEDDEELEQAGASAALGGGAFAEEVYNPADTADDDFDFVSSTSAGLPQQFSNLATGGSSSSSSSGGGGGDEDDERVVDYYEILRQSMADKEREKERGPPMQSKVKGKQDKEAPQPLQQPVQQQPASASAAAPAPAAPAAAAPAAPATRPKPQSYAGAAGAQEPSRDEAIQGGAAQGPGGMDSAFPPLGASFGPNMGPPPHMMGAPPSVPIMPMPVPPHMMGGPPPGNPPFMPMPGAPPQAQQQRKPQSREPHVPPVPIRQPRTFPNIRSINDVRPAKYMSRNDIRFVLSRILSPLETEDAYTEDYYFIQMQVRKNAKLRAEAEKAQQAQAQAQEKGEDERAAAAPAVAMPPDLIIPLPTWKETKAKLRARMAQSQRDILRKNRDWATKEGSLGIQARSSVRNPKKQLAITSVRDIWSSGTAEATEGEEAAAGSTGAAPAYVDPFATKLWKVRASILQCHDSLCSVRELDQLLRYYQRHASLKAHAFHLHQNSTAVVSARQAAMNSGDAATVAAAQRTAAQQHESFANEQRAMEEVVRDIMQERNTAVDTLALSIGITAATPNPDSDRGLDIDVSSNTTLDAALFTALLSTLKGKKLLLEALPLLTPAQRWALAPTLLVKVLHNAFSVPASTNAVPSSSGSGSVERELEVKVLESLLQFVVAAHSFQQEQEARHMNIVGQYHHHAFVHAQQGSTEPLPPPPPPHAFMTVLLFKRIIDCVGTIVKAFSTGNGDTAGNKLRPSLLSSRYRSELLHVMTTVAEEIADRLVSSTAGATGPDGEGGGPLAGAVREWNDVRGRFVSMLDQE